MKWEKCRILYTCITVHQVRSITKKNGMSPAYINYLDWFKFSSIKKQNIAENETKKNIKCAVFVVTIDYFLFSFLSL